MSENPDDQADDFQEGQQERSRPTSAAAGAVGGWGISAVVHLAAVAVMWVAVFAAPKVEVEVPPTRINSIPPPPAKEEKKERTDQNVETKVEIQPTDSEVVTPVVAKVEVPKDPTEQPTETDSPNRGREEAAAESETGGSGVTMNIGAGASGGAGMMGLRTGASKKMAVQKGGGSRASEIAVESSLRWFMKHQSPNGSWDPVKYYQNCTDGAKCEPGNYNFDANGAGGSGQDGTTTAVTGYAVLCFLGAGYDHQTPNKYKSTVKKGVDFLVSQLKGGTWGRNYEHPIALMALSEALAMTQDSTLVQPCQSALAYLLSKQNQDGGFGWDYKGPNKRNDASTTGWNVMALKSALAAGLNIGKGMDNAKIWVDKHWRASNHPSVVKAGVAFKDAASMTSKDCSRFAYCWFTGEDAIRLADSEPPAAVNKADPKAKGPAVAAEPKKPDSQMSDKPSSGGKSLECVGLVCSIFLGKSATDPMVESLANTVVQYQMPRPGNMKIYYTYYNTLSLFQLGGDRWKDWNGKVRDLLVNSQEKTSDCKDGSWDPNVVGGLGIGRTLSTAYNTLSLEVYYRYKQIQHH